MPEIDTVASGETIESAWGNAIRDRTLQRYTNTTERDNLNPAPTEGDLAYIESTNTAQFYSGAAWVDFITNSNFPTLSYLPLAGGTLTGAVYGFAGSAAVPSFAFAVDGNTGLYADGNDGQVKWSGNSVQGGYLWGAGVRVVDGSPATPSLGFMSDADTGFYLSATGLIRWAGFGAAGGLLHSAGVRTVDGATGTPAYSFVDDIDTGLLRLGTNHVGITAGGNIVLSATATVTELRAAGATVLSATSSSVAFPNAGTTTNNTLPGWRQLGSTDRSLNALVSGAKFKRGIRDAEVAELLTDLWAIKLRRWQDKGSPKDSPWYTGMVADEAIELPTLTATVDRDEDGDPYGFDQVNATHNHLVAGVQYLKQVTDQLERRLALLEQ